MRETSWVALHAEGKRDNTRSSAGARANWAQPTLKNDLLYEVWCMGLAVKTRIFKLEESVTFF